jgi:4-hydroxyproline epimerase
MHTAGIIDSHTAGDPTRLVIEGAPDLGGGSLAERLTVLRECYDWFRSAVDLGGAEGHTGPSHTWLILAIG